VQTPSEVASIQPPSSSLASPSPALPTSTTNRPSPSSTPSKATSSPSVVKTPSGTQAKSSSPVPSTFSDVPPQKETEGFQIGTIGAGASIAILIVIIVVLLAAIAVAVFFAVKYFKKKETEDKDFFLQDTSTGRN
jgi:cobalamin biosynthesis Mg chelatase CobN